MKFFKGKLAGYGFKVVFNPNQILYLENLHDLSQLRATLVAPNVTIYDIEEPEKLLKVLNIEKEEK